MTPAGQIGDLVHGGGDHDDVDVLANGGEVRLDVRKPSVSPQPIGGGGVAGVADGVDGRIDPPQCFGDAAAEQTDADDRNGSDRRRFGRGHAGNLVCRVEFVDERSAVVIRRRRGDMF